MMEGGNHKDQQQSPQNPLPGKVIFLAFLTPENRVGVICYSKHIPSLSYISKLLDSEITELIVQEKIKEEEKSAPKIEVPGKHFIPGLRTFLHRRK